MELFIVVGRVIGLWVAVSFSRASGLMLPWFATLWCFAADSLLLRCSWPRVRRAVLLVGSAAWLAAFLQCCDGSLFVAVCLIFLPVV